MDFISVPYWCPVRDAGRTEMNVEKNGLREGSVIKENIKKLLLGIFVVTLLLMVCVSIDYADNISNDTITNINSSTLQINNSKFIMLKCAMAFVPRPTVTISTKS